LDWSPYAFSKWRKLKCWLTFPLSTPICLWTRFVSRVSTPWPCVQMLPLLETPKCPEPLCPSEALPRSARSLLPRVGGHYPSFFALTDSCARPPSSPCLRLPPRSSSLCRLLPAPAGCWPFPTLSLQVFPWMPGPIPRRLLRCLYPFLPRGLRPSPLSDRVGSPAPYPYSDFRTESFSGLQTFLNVQASKFARHPGRSDRYHPRAMAAVTFTSEPRIVRYLSIRRIC
jgi:hypothetical protein